MRGVPAASKLQHDRHGQPFDFNRTPGNLLGVDTPRKALRVAALLFAVIGVTLAVASAVLTWSLPYRIGPHEYGRYLWSGRIWGLAFVMPIGALLLGIASRQKLSVALTVVSWAM